MAQGQGDGPIVTHWQRCLGDLYQWARRPSWSRPWSSIVVARMSLRRWHGGYEISGTYPEEIRGKTDDCVDWDHEEQTHNI